MLSLWVYIVTSAKAWRNTLPVYKKYYMNLQGNHYAIDKQIKFGVSFYDFHFHLTC